MLGVVVEGQHLDTRRPRAFDICVAVFVGAALTLAGFNYDAIARLTNTRPTVDALVGGHVNKK